jgi:hypothetical protein
MLNQKATHVPSNKNILKQINEKIGVIQSPLENFFFLKKKYIYN